jgi:hypothetical protein
MRTVFLSCHFGDSDRELVRQGKDRWTWSVWIDGPPERLDEIEYVEYIPHPTFREPVRRVADRSSQFRLNSRGWDEFTIHANVITHAGQKLRLDHWLKLEDVGTSAGIRELAAGKLTIFVSYSRADYPLAAELCRFLNSKGFKVVTDNELSPEEPIDRAMKSLISRSDAMLALIADEPGRWVLNEIFEAQKQQVPVIPFSSAKRLASLHLSQIKRW